MPLTREQAVRLLNTHVKNERMLNHSYAAEAVMKALARRLGADEEKWAMAGLLHDLDIEIVEGDLTIHGLETERILNETDLNREIIEAIVMHNETVRNKKRESEFQHALAAGETVTGLITATAMVYPDKKLASVKVKSLTKRMKEKAFAASVNRDIIRECELIGIPLEEFMAISLNAMTEIGGQLSL